MLGEYEFDYNKIPAAILEQVGTPGGNVHTWSLTLDPEWKYKDEWQLGWLHYWRRRILSPS